MAEERKKKRKGGKRWMQGAVHPSRRGAATRAAKRAGMSLTEWARKHQHDSNKRTRGEAAFALRAKSIARKHKHRKHKRGSRRA